VNPSAITTTEAVDKVFLFIFGISALLLVGIVATIIFFLVKYNRRRSPAPQPSPNYNIPLETAWTILPTVIVLAMFWYGWAGYTTLRDVPEDAMEVKVVGRQWSWSFTYPNGKVADKLVVPVGRAVKLNITSEDVLHSFYVPAFRVKKDAVPGMTTRIWFRAPAAGSYDAFCAEYCGVAHSAMITSVEAMPEEEFDRWYKKPPEGERSEAGAVLRKYGCTGCHSLDGSKMVGPTFKGLFGRQVTVATDGRERTVTADEEYIKRSILEPQADVVKGYPPVMPTFEGKIADREIEEIVEFLRGKTEGKKAGLSGAELAVRKGCAGCHTTDGGYGVGPTWKGLFGGEETVVTGGKERTVTADEEYIKRSILQPQADLVKGYPSVMPATPMTEAELAALIDYIKGLR
jgi:cytochrome c oxidase subunit 2